VPTRVGLLSAFRPRILLLLAVLGTCLRAAFSLVAIGLFSSAYQCLALRSSKNIQYRVILARARRCVRLLSRLRAEATAKRNYD
jgi:hypothetical protein